jgi:PAS domain S-box-containing protein
MSEQAPPDATDPNGSSISPPGRIIGSGEMADRVRNYDWKSTALGPIETWSKELLTIVNLTLASPSPARTMWGPDFILIYNDAYRAIPGPRHPFALGKAATKVYGESWHVVGPLLDKAFATGETLFYEKLLVPLPTENGIQDFYLNYSFNPIFENGKIAGLFGPLHDVTGEVLAARKLQESEARANRILGSIGDAVIVTDAEARITRMNPIAEVLTGWKMDEAAGRPMTDVFRIVSESTRLPVESPAEKVKRLGTIVGLANHTVLIARDSRETHIDDSGAPILNDDGELIGIVLVFRDITDRRAAERERDAVAERLNQVLESTTDAIISVDRNWRISYTNAPARAIVAPVEIIPGKGFWETFPGAIYKSSPYVEHYERAMRDGIGAEFEARSAAQASIWVRVNVRPSRDGIVIFFRDVTEEKRAAALLGETTRALKESEEELRWTIDLSTQVPWTADVEGRILDFSDGWLRLTGLTREYALGDGWANAPHRDDLPRMRAAWRHALSTGEPYSVEHRIKTASGAYRWMRSNAFPRRNDAGEIVKWYGTTEDIEDRKRAEHALLQSEKLAAVGRLASSIAHEINNPLEAVTNLLYLAQNNESLPKVREYLETADIELRRVAVITNQALRFHRQSTYPQPVRCEDLFDSALLIYRGRLQNANIAIQTRHRAAAQIRCFDGEIRQVLSNLIGNAIDALHPGVGRLFFRSRHGLDWKTGRRGVVLTVADTGSGMDKQTMGNIFDAFFTTKEIGGTGLGLWISKDIVERHHGVLRVRSSQQRGQSGTVFTLFLPFDAVGR